MEAVVAAINAFSLSGIRVRIDGSWFIAFLLFAWTLSVGYFPLQVPDQPASIYWLAGTLSSLGLFACVLLHELSHCLAAKKLGTEVRQITLFIFGGVSEMSLNEQGTPASEFRIAIAGPLASLGLGVIFFAASLGATALAGRVAVEVLRYMSYVNLVLAAFNAMPGFPLDGGRVLRSYLWRRTGNLTRATNAAARIGEVFAMALMGAGLLSALSMHVLPGAWLVVLGLFLKNSARREYQSFEMRAGLQAMTVRQIMRPAVGVNSSMKLSEFVNEFVFHYHHRVFPVLELNRFVGMIDVRSLKNVPAAEWSVISVGSCLSDPNTYCVLNPDTEAMEALNGFASQNCRMGAVVRNGELLGILTQSDLFKVISLKRDIAA
jgi:Zn-dependent protease/CBS domain-containing protein